MTCKRIEIRKCAHTNLTIIIIIIIIIIITTAFRQGIALHVNRSSK